MFVLKGEQFNGNVSYTNGSFFSTERAGIWHFSRMRVERTKKSAVFPVMPFPWMSYMCIHRALMWHQPFIHTHWNGRSLHALNTLRVYFISVAPHFEQIAHLEIEVEKRNLAYTQWMLTRVQTSYPSFKHSIQNVNMLRRKCVFTEMYYIHIGNNVFSPFCSQRSKQFKNFNIKKNLYEQKTEIVLQIGISVCYFRL